MIASLLDIRAWMTRYLMSMFLVLGLLGNMINIYMFTRKDFRRNSCSLYLLATSCANIISVVWGISPALHTLDNPDPSTYSYLYCKLRLYTIHTSLMIGRSFIILACFDRYALCSQSIRFRAICQAKMAIRIILATILLWPILTLHIILLQNFSNNQCSRSGSYALIYGIYSTLAAGIVPPVLMTTFSVLTIRHRRELRTRLNGLDVHRRRDHSLVVMLSSEVIVYVVTTSLYPAIALYQALTNNQVKSAQSLQIEAFVSFLGDSFLIYLNSASVFYVYLIGSSSFRKECQLVLTKALQKLTRTTHQVHPTITNVNNAVHFTTPNSIAIHRVH